MYLGPDTAMPLASALAVVAGVVVVFWHRTKALFQRMGRSVGGFLARLGGRR